MLETKIRKGTFQHVETELFSYHETKRELIRLRNEIMNAYKPMDENGKIKGNLPGDPTSKVATLLVTNSMIEHMEKVIKAIESVYERLPADKQKLVKLKYWTRPQTLTWDGIAQEIHVSRRQALYWRDEVIYAVADMLGWR